MGMGMGSSRFTNVLRYGTWYYPANKAYANRGGNTTVYCDKCRAPNLAGALHYDNVDLCPECIRDETVRLGSDTGSWKVLSKDTHYSPFNALSASFGPILEVSSNLQA